MNRQIHVLERAVHELARAVGGSQKSLTRARVLLAVAVAGRDGISTLELGRRIGICGTGLRAHLGALGTRDRWGRRGSGYLRGRRDGWPDIVYTLTARGEQLVQKIEGQLGR